MLQRIKRTFSTLQKKRKLKKKQKALEKKPYMFIHPFTFVNSKVLAKEALLTLNFVERIHRKTGRQVLVVPIGNTGEPYTWGISAIKPKGVKLMSQVDYPSTDSGPVLFNRHFAKILDQYSAQRSNPIIVCVDSTRKSRMPSSFTGHPDNLRDYTNKEFSLKTKFEKSKFRVILAGYNYSLKKNSNKPNVDKLPKVEVKKNERVVVLLNPSKERKIPIASSSSNPGKWGSATHDDLTYAISKEFKEHVQNQIRLAKKQF